jgi:hypothetical protein
MNAMKKKNPLTESFLVQLDVDLESLGMRNPKYKSVFAYNEDTVSEPLFPLIALLIQAAIEHKGSKAE